jgi:hypothetical protein
MCVSKVIIAWQPRLKRSKHFLSRPWEELRHGPNPFRTGPRPRIVTSLFSLPAPEIRAHVGKSGPWQQLAGLGCGGEPAWRPSGRVPPKPSRRPPAPCAPVGRCHATLYGYATVSATARQAHVTADRGVRIRSWPSRSSPTRPRAKVLVRMERTRGGEDPKPGQARY